MTNFFIYYIIIINLYGIYVMYKDKKKAIKNQWRVPEIALFSVAFAFGSVGIMFGMRMFRHKTKHFKFVYGIPVILLLQVYIILKLFKVL